MREGRRLRARCDVPPGQVRGAREGRLDAGGHDVHDGMPRWYGRLRLQSLWLRRFAFRQEALRAAARGPSGALTWNDSSKRPSHFFARSAARQRYQLATVR